MKRFLSCVILLGLLGTGVVLAQREIAPQQSRNVASRANDGAFRDGLYLGKRARSTKRPEHIAVGRWSAESDRASFAEGYREGFGSR